MKHKHVKKQEAEARNKAWRELSPKEQLKMLDTIRRGWSRCEKQREKLRKGAGK